jgi:hypothetical protein
MKRLAILSLAAFAVCAAGCGDSPATASTQPAKATVDVVGTYRIQGGPAPGINRPLSGTIVIHSGSETGKIVDTVTATNGHFHATVAPGSYVAVGTTGSGAHLICTSGLPAKAKPGHTLHLNVRCDVP